MNKFAVIVYNKDGTKHTVYNGEKYYRACCIYDELANDKSVHHVALFDCITDSILESR